MVKDSHFLAAILIVALVAIASISLSVMETGTNKAGMAGLSPTFLGPPETGTDTLVKPTEYLGPPTPDVKIGSGEAGTKPAEYRPPSRERDIPINDDARDNEPSTIPQYDVIVAGAGSGGIAAAIQASRMGASVLLIEETDVVGGQIIPVGNMDGGYNPPAGTGIYEEFESRMRAYYADPVRFPPSGKSIGTCYWSAGTSCFEPRASQLILRQMLAEEDVTLWTQHRITSVTKSGSTVTGVVANGKQVRSEVLIDATEYGDVIPLTGARYAIGNSLSPNINPNSCVDDITYTAMIKEYPAGIPAQFRITSPPPGYAAYKEEFKRTVTLNGAQTWKGQYPVGWPVHNAYRGVPDSTRPGSYTGNQMALITKTYANWANDYPAYATYNPLPQGKIYNLSVKYIENPADRTRMNCEAKLKTINFLYYVQEMGLNWSIADEGFDTAYNRAHLCADIPQDLKTIERHMPPFPYVREARRIVSIDMYTAKEMKASRAGTPIPSSIAVGDYGVDKHNCRDNSTLDYGDSTNEWHQGGYFQVPMETLIPEQIDGFLAAEKNIGVSRLAEGAIRLQPITMATGQAAGMLAAISAIDNIPPRNVPAAKVQRELARSGSAISNMHFTDVPLTHAYWDDVQLTTVDRTLVGYGGRRFGPADPLLRGQAAVAVVNMFDIDTASPTQPSFTDVPRSHLFYKYVEALKRDGITAGCSVNPPKFCINDPITRFQLSVFLTAAGGFTPSERHSFADVGQSQQRFIDIAIERGWFEPCSQGFCPNQPVTRAEMARIIALERE
jgi:hypothetical protein